MTNIGDTENARSVGAASRRGMRIGILQGEKLVEERVIAKSGDITIGQSGRDTFVIPPSGAASRSRKLFWIDATATATATANSNARETRSGRGCSVLLDADMEGQMAVDGTAGIVRVCDLLGPRFSAGAGRRTDVRIPLGEGARGKLRFGDLTVLFQVVRVPDPAPRPRLPPSLRGSLVANFDWLMLALVAASLFSHAAFVVYLNGLHVPLAARADELREKDLSVLFAHHMWKLPEPPQPPPATRVSPNRPQRHAGDGRTAVRTPRATDGKQEADRRAALAVAMLRILGARGEGESAVRDLLRDGGLADNANEAFEGMGGVGIASSDSKLGAWHGPGAGTVRGVTTRTLGMPVGVFTPDPVAERQPLWPGGLRPAPTTVVVDHGCDATAIANELKHHTSALTACYQRATHAGVGLRGKLTMRLSMSGAGRVMKAEIEEDSIGDAVLSNCLASSASRWLFPVEVAGESGCREIAFPIIFQPADR